MESSVIGALHGRYELTEVLKDDELGQVFRAFDRLHEQEVILKGANGSERPADDLIREFTALTRIRHPRLARVLDLGADEQGRPYMTMAPVDGRSLAEQPLPLALDEVLRLMHQLLDGLSALHRRHLVHGDVKPDNLMLTPGGDLVLIDLGFTSVSGRTALGGSLHTMAPEVVRGSATDPRADLFSVGAVMLWLCTGTPPFASGPPLRIDSAWEAELAPAAEVLDDEHLQLLRRLLDPRPEKRPPDAHHLLTDLGHPVDRNDSGDLPLVGRSKLLETLLARSPRQGEGGGLALVVGEFGLGKSRLLEELKWRAQLRGNLVLESRHHRDEPFDSTPLVRMVRLLATAGEGGSKALDASQPFRRGDGDWSAALEDLWMTLSRRASQGPILLVDCLEMATREALEAATFLASALDDGTGIQLVFAGQPSPQVDALRKRLAPDEVHELHPLDVEAIDKIVAERAPHRRGDAKKLWTLTNGNPRLIAESLRSGGFLGDSLEGAQRAWRAQLNDDELEVVALFAAFGMPMPQRLVHALGVEAIADELELARHLDRVGHAWDLCSPALGDAALAAVDEVEVHRRLARACREAGIAEAQCIRHEVWSHVPVDPAVALDAAQELAAAGSTDLARDLIEGTHPQIASTPQRFPRAAAVLAELASYAGELERAESIQRALVQSLEGEEGGIAALALARTLQRRGHHVEAATVADHGLSLLEAPDQRARAYELLARITLMTGDSQTAIHWARRGLAEGCDRRSQLRSTLAAAHLYLGNAQEARRAAEDAVDEARAAGDIRAEAAALGHAAMAASALSHREISRELFEKALEAAEHGGDVASIPTYLLNLGTALHELGRFDRAIELFERAEHLAKRHDNRSSRVAALSNLGNLLLQLGATPEARAAIETSAELASASGMRLYEAQSALLLAELARAEGHRKLTEEWLSRAEQLFTELQAKAQLNETRLLRAELLARDGAFEAALSAAPALGEDLGHLTARARLLAGEVAISRGHLDHAREAATEAREKAKSSGQLNMEARAELLLAQVYEAASSPLASNHRERALQLVTELAIHVPPGLRELFWSTEHWSQLRDNSRQRQSPTAETVFDERAFRLLELNRRILGEHEESRILEAALDVAVEVCGAERGFIILLRESSSAAKIAAARNIDRETIKNPRWKFSRSVAQEVAERGEPVVTVNASEDSRFTSAKSVHHLGLQSVLCVPVRAPERVLGTIYLDNRFLRGRFGDFDLRLASAVADQAAVALVNARLHRDNRERTEALTRAREELAQRYADKEEQVARLERDLRQSRKLRHEYGTIIGRSPVMRRALELVDRVTESDVPVLIEGQSGTGKELVARALHDNGPRAAKGPFVSINCSALPQPLLESELFGHKRGAFTGADQPRMGLFREAHGGSLFLDEVGDMDLAMQAKLLRVLQEGEVRPVGGDRVFRVDVRVIAATNKPLARQVERGYFRQDLMFRLAVVRVELPPLSARPEDLPELCLFLLKRTAEKLGRPEKQITRRAIETLSKSELPGNVRQLDNILTNAALMTDSDTIDVADLPLAELGLERGVRSRQEAIATFDREVLLEALSEVGWNKRRAAAQLGISRPTLYRRMKRYGIPKERPPSSRKHSDLD